MILVDTSVWIDHLRQDDPGLSRLLSNGLVVTHPFIVGEISLGSLGRRGAVLNALRGLPHIAPLPDDDVLNVIESEALFGLGIGYIDAHLLASAIGDPQTRLWTRDKRLAAAARRFDLAYRG